MERAADITLGDILRDPTLLMDTSPADLQHVIDEALRTGWILATLGRGSRSGEGLMLREARAGRLTGRIIQRHPGGGHHGPEPYWKVSTPERGLIRIGPQFQSGRFTGT